ncbi:LCP family protein [Streptomyces griseocarneus]|uniref:LCP family protein n=1 Tax=Streptomyces griseocarneus TaxID=51201 RepID=UPI0019B2275B|nr:LCP family protein [Streptomyces griseocarneus]MBZ6475661.1 LCP family protein [Streptomyces griseocarneus]GHG68991.1 membrane protein [Streptomyces griseocarneus]
MNDRQDSQPRQQVHGYDAYGRPVYRPDAPERVYDQYGQWIPRQAGPSAPAPAPDTALASAPAPASPQIPEPRPAPDAPDYRTEQFAFVEEPDEDSQDVIDWLKFSASRAERRGERRRRGRNRVTAVAVVLGLAVVGGITWLLLSGGGDERDEAATGGTRVRDVIVVHLRQTRGGESSTALLVDDERAHKGTTLLLPDSLAVAREGGGATTLGRSVLDAGTGGTRDALNTLLGTGIKGSWRLDTPYLENLVELVGGVTVDTDTAVPGAGRGDRPLVTRGEGQSLGGRAAVAYATYRAAGEGRTAQLTRFGRVMQAVLRKMSGDPRAATTTVESLAQIPDPSLSTEQLGASLARLAAKAKAGSYETTVLPVRADGTLGGRAADTLIEEVLGGAARDAAGNAPPRVGVNNATGDAGAAESARVTLANGGYTAIGAGTARAPRAASAVLYAEEGRAAEAREVARTLGLPERAVRRGEVPAHADVAVVLGRDYLPRTR